MRVTRAQARDAVCEWMCINIKDLAEVDERVARERGRERATRRETAARDGETRMVDPASGSPVRWRFVFRGASRVA